MLDDRRIMAIKTANGIVDTVRFVAYNGLESLEGQRREEQLIAGPPAACFHVGRSRWLLASAQAPAHVQTWPSRFDHTFEAIPQFVGRGTMPPLARIYIKASFVYFVAAFVLGATVMLDRWLVFSRWLRLVYVSQVHLLMVGWITQLAIGVAYWMFPRFLKEQDSRGRGSDRLAWFVFVTLNAGLLLRLVCEPFYLMGPQSWLAALLALSGVLQAVSAIGFGVLIWGRVRPMER